MGNYYACYRCSSLYTRVLAFIKMGYSETGKNDFASYADRVDLVPLPKSQEGNFVYLMKNSAWKLSPASAAVGNLR